MNQPTPTTNPILYETLFFALGMRRPHKGANVERLGRYIEQHFSGKTRRDGANNIHLDLRGSGSRTLFVAHLDTVHRADGKNPVDRSKKGWVRAVKGGSQALGADDGAGVALLCHMAKQGVPGYYIFTQGEEVGGVGARYLATKQTKLLGEFDRAIAFDRKDVWSVITHQGWSGRCCSDAFGDALSAALSGGELIYAPDATGVYTDTAEFVDFIPECTNISVGYYHEHSDREALDLMHFSKLAKAVVSFDWDALPTDRKPGSDDPFTLETAKASVSSSWTKGEYELIDALEAAMQGRNEALVEMLSNRLIGDDSAEMTLSRQRIDDALLDDAFDDLSAYGVTVALDVLLDKIIRNQTN